MRRGGQGLAVVLALGGCGEAETQGLGGRCDVIRGPPGTLVGERDRACTTDAECTTAPSSCCGCDNGGTHSAINRAAVDAVAARRTETCGALVACNAIYQCLSLEVACVAGRCELCEGTAD